MFACAFVSESFLRVVVFVSSFHCIQINMFISNSNSSTCIVLLYFASVFLILAGNCFYAVFCVFKLQ